MARQERVTIEEECDACGATFERSKGMASEVLSLAADIDGTCVVSWREVCRSCLSGMSAQRLLREKIVPVGGYAPVRHLLDSEYAADEAPLAEALAVSDPADPRVRIDRALRVLREIDISCYVGPLSRAVVEALAILEGGEKVDPEA